MEARSGRCHSSSLERRIIRSERGGIECDWWGLMEKAREPIVWLALTLTHLIVHTLSHNRPLFERRTCGQVQLSRRRRPRLGLNGPDGLAAAMWLRDDALPHNE